MKEFYGKDQAAKQSVINKIFAGSSATSQSASKAARDASASNQQPPKVGNFVKVQRGSAAQLAMIRQQVASQDAQPQPQPASTQKGLPPRQSFEQRALATATSKAQAHNSHSSGSSAEPTKPTFYQSGRGSQPPPAHRKSASQAKSARQQNERRTSSNRPMQMTASSNFMIAPVNAPGADLSNENSND